MGNFKQWLENGAGITLFAGLHDAVMEKDVVNTVKLYNALIESENEYTETNIIPRLKALTEEEWYARFPGTLRPEKEWWQWSRAFSDEYNFVGVGRTVDQQSLKYLHDTYAKLRPLKLKPYYAQFTEMMVYNLSALYNSLNKGIPFYRRDDHDYTVMEIKALEKAWYG